MAFQTTIAAPVSYTGVGLHSGKDVTMKLQPAEADTGIVFTRVDLPGQPQVEAKAENVTSTLRATTIEDNGIKMFTIEHVMSALHGAGIDNVEICINAEEPPVADGSSREFFQLLQKAGIHQLDRERQEIVIDQLYRVDDGDKFVLALPYDGFRVSFTSINPHPLIGIQYGDYEITEVNYLKEIAPARTIAYEKEVEALHKMGLWICGTL